MAEGYQSWPAIFAALKSTAKANTDPATGRGVNELLANAMFDRLLSRIFHDPHDTGWLLKGGTSMLARIPTARHTSDIDLATAGTLDDATETLAELAGRDIGDHLTFEIRDVRQGSKGQNQPGVEVRRLLFVATEPGRPKIVAEVPIDLVVSTPPVGQIQTITPAHRLELPKPLPTSPYRLYPMVDHIADKVCATMMTFPGGRPSSRVKDLVDLALIAHTQTVDLDQLRLAITTKRALGNLDEFTTHFTITTGWETKYRLLASRVPNLSGTDLTEALEIVTALVDPALTPPGTHPAGTWSPTTNTWTETTTPGTAGAQKTATQAPQSNDVGQTVHVRTHTRNGILIREHHRNPRHHP